jgi:hypothetical protein
MRRSVRTLRFEHNGLNKEALWVISEKNGPPGPTLVADYLPRFTVGMNAGLTGTYFNGNVIAQGTGLDPASTITDRSPIVGS